MSYVQCITLAIIQGLTEFLPVSSSAHLILISKLFAWPEQGIGFDVALHLGTLLSVVFYFRKDLQVLCIEAIHSLQMRRYTPTSRLFWYIGIATLPVCISGVLGRHWIAIHLRSSYVLAYSTVFFALILGYAAYKGSEKKTEYNLSLLDTIKIGCAQALALIPGVSRSGITLTAGLLLGLERKAAARFSFLLSIPVIIAAVLLESFHLLQTPEIYPIPIPIVALGIGVSFITGLLCIHLFLNLLTIIGLWPFIVYRLLLGSLLFFFY